MKKAISILIKDVILKALLKKLVASASFLGWPIIGPFVEMLLGWLADFLQDKVVYLIDNKIIEMKVGSQNKEYKEAATKLEIELSKPEGEQDAAKTEQAKQEFKDSLSKLINMGP